MGLDNSECMLPTFHALLAKGDAITAGMEERVADMEEKEFVDELLKHKAHGSADTPEPLRQPPHRPPLHLHRLEAARNHLRLRSPTARIQHRRLRLVRLL